MMQEVESNPATKHLLMQMMATEGGGRGGQGAVEALFNRVAMIRQKVPGYTIAQELRSGFYGPLNRGARPHIGAALAARDQAILNEVYGGSDLIQGRTDQGTFGDPNAAGPGRVRFPGMQRSEIYNFWKGSRGGFGFSHEDSRRFAEQQEARRQLDESQQNVFVKGSGKISVDVKAPYHTAVNAEGSGIFDQTEINRQFQMVPAQSGEPVRRFEPNIRIRE